MIDEEIKTSATCHFSVNFIPLLQQDFSCCFPEVHVRVTATQSIQSSIVTSHFRAEVCSQLAQHLCFKRLSMCETVSRIIHLQFQQMLTFLFLYLKG